MGDQKKDDKTTTTGRKYIPPVKGGSRVKSVPRLIRQDATMFCGICRTKYFTRQEAIDCVEKCMPSFFESHCVSSVQSGNSTAYKCDICGTMFASKAKADSCNHHCQEKARRNLEEAKGELSQKHGNEATSAASVAVTDKKKSDAPSGQSKPAAAAKPAANENSSFAKRSGQKPFFRDGARYICTACKKKYFTKNEVEDCYDSHPLAG